MSAPVVYLDTCALNRLTDDLTQPRLLAEERAITTIFSLIDSQDITWVASTLLAFEIARNPNPYKRVFASAFLPPEEQLIPPLAPTFARAAQLTKLGLALADALISLWRNKRKPTGSSPRTTACFAAPPTGTSRQNVSIL